MPEALDLRQQARLGAAFSLLAEAGGTSRADGMAKGVQFGGTVRTNGTALTKGQLVKSDGTDDIGPGAKVQVATAATDRVIGIALEDIAVGFGGAIGVVGIVLVQTTGTVAVWDVLYGSGTTGRASATATAGATIIGRSLNSASGSDTVWAFVNILSAASSDHGFLTGLTDDDHTQYLKETDVAAKGDIYAASANDVVGVLSPGADGQVLTVDSTQSLGVKWGATTASTAETVIKDLTNKSGGTVNRGDVVVVDETTNESFTTNTTLDAETSLGIVQETISNNAVGAVALVGYIDLTNTADISWSRGDYIYAGSNAKIVHGSNTRNPGAFGQFFKSGSNSSAWLWGAGDQTAVGGGDGGTSAFVGAKAYADATQSIPDATSTAVAFNLEEYDTDGFHDNATNNSRFTVPSGKAGKYGLKGGTRFAASASPVLAQLWWRLNGTTNIRGGNIWIPSSGQPTGFIVTTDVVLAVGDYVELIVYQDSSGARNIGHASAPEAQSFGAVSLLGT